jgi:colanic acid/amylovoran biosynthesis protein
MNILIVNLHSALNLGDDAIMQATLQALQESFPAATITAAANDPDSWRKYRDIQVVGSLTCWVIDRANGRWRWRRPQVVIYVGLLALAVGLYRALKVKFLFGSAEQRRLLGAYYSADLVLSCGGGNFYAYRSFSIAYLWALATLWLAWALGKRTILLPQSIGPVAGRFQRWLARWVFSRPAQIMLREQLSAQFLADLGLGRDPIVLADLAFALSPAADNLSLPDANGAQLRVGVTVIDRGAQERSFTQQGAYETILSDLLIQVQQEFQAQVYIFVQCYGPTPDQDDRRCARRVYERVRAHTEAVTLMPDFHDALDIRAAYRQLDCLIGTRLHTGIFALSQAVPVVLIGYQPKAAGMMALLGLERYCPDITAITGEDLLKLTRELIQQRLVLRSYIAARYAELQATLQNWSHWLGE